MSKRKRGAHDERRRASIEINLLADSEEAGRLGRARRGCSLPFLGSAMVLTALVILRASLA